MTRFHRSLALMTAVTFSLSGATGWASTKTRQMDSAAAGGTGMDMSSKKASSDYERGIALYLQENYGEAIVAFKTHLKDHPDHAPSKEWIGLIEALGPVSAPVNTPARPVGEATAARIQAASSPAVSSAASALPSTPEVQTAIDKFQAEYQKARAEADRLRAESSKKDAAIAALQTSQTANDRKNQEILTGLQKKIDVKTAEIEEVRKDLAVSQDQTRRAMEQSKQLMALQPKEGSSAPKTPDNSKELEKLRTEKSKLETNLSDLSRSVADRDRAIESIRSERDAVQKNLVASAAQIEQMKKAPSASAVPASASSKTETEYANKLKDLAAERAELAKSRADYEKTRLQLQSSVAEIQKIREEITSTGGAPAVNGASDANIKELGSLRQERESLRRQLAELSSGKSGQTDALKTLQKSFDELQVQHRNLSSNYDAIRGRTEAVEAERSKLLKEIADLRSSMQKPSDVESRAAVLAAELEKTKLSNADLLRRLAGTEQSLGQVSKKYELAEEARVALISGQTKTEAVRKGLESNVQALAQTKDDLAKQLAAAQDKIRQLEAAVQRSREAVKAADAQTAQHAAEISRGLETAEKNRILAENRLAELAKNAELLSKELAELKSGRQTLLTHQASQTAKAKELEAKYQASLDRNRTLEQQDQQQLSTLKAKLDQTAAELQETERVLGQVSAKSDAAVAEAASLRKSAEASQLSLTQLQKASDTRTTELSKALETARRESAELSKTLTIERASEQIQKSQVEDLRKQLLSSLDQLDSIHENR